MSRGLRRFLYSLVPACFTYALAASVPAHAVVDVRGFVSAGGVQTDAPASWRTSQGFGVLDLGLDAQGNDSEESRGDLHLVIDASAEVGGGTTLGAFLHLAARAEPDAIGGEEAGIVEAYLETRWRLRDADVLRLQAGQFLLPTSRENVSWAWSSPYTLTFSALNSWIAEELRPTGLALEYRAAVGDFDQLRFGASAFGGNDTAGALLAWRGWAMHDRITFWDEVAPLPPSPALSPGRPFGDQRDDGTLAFGQDLDDQIGYAAWVAWHHGDRSMGQISYYDNRADRALWASGDGFEYAWDTYFWHAAWELHFGGLTLASEWMEGESGMGFAGSPHVDIDFESSYLLASYLTEPWLGGTWRLTVRYDDFETVDIDQISPVFQDDNDSEGDALTAALFWEWTRRPLRIGVEYLHVDSTRDQAAASGFGVDGELGQVGGEQVRLELRYFFGQ